MSFTFGSDSEFFLALGEDIYSAIPVLKSTSDKRNKINGHEFYYDNVLAECAIKYGHNKQEVIENFRECLNIFTKIINPYELLILASTKFPEDQLIHPHSKEAGCNPEWCAYKLQYVMPPNEFMSQNKTGMYIHTTNFRTAGGHIHLGFDFDTFKKPIIIYMMDLFIGIPSVLMDKDKTSKNRKKVYGLAGRYRDKEYGIEYRTLSSFWLNSPKKVELMWNLCEFVLNFVSDGKADKFWTLTDEDDEPVYSCYGYDAEILQKTINTCDKIQAEKFMRFIENYLHADIVKQIYSEINDFGDFYRNWHLVK